MPVKINIDENEVIFSLNTKVYPKEIILKTAYIFIDHFYIYLDSPKKNAISVAVKGKIQIPKANFKKIRGEFLNELLNGLLREEINRKNKKLLEYIVSGAINSSLEGAKKNAQAEGSGIEKEIELLKKELLGIEADDYINDPLGIKKTPGKREKKK